MTERPAAATGTFPYPHKTVAEVDAADRAAKFIALLRSPQTSRVGALRGRA